MKDTKNAHTFSKNIYIYLMYLRIPNTFCASYINVLNFKHALQIAKAIVENAIEKTQ